MIQRFKPEDIEEIQRAIKNRAIKNIKDLKGAGCLIIDADGNLVKDEDGDAPQLFICDNEERD